MANKRYVCGSRAFFEGLDGFVPGDTDYTEFIDKEYEKYECPFIHTHIEVDGKKCCLWQWVTTTADGYVDIINTEKRENCLTPFLVPEIAESVGFTVEHLKKVKRFIEYFEYRLSYYKIIAEAYLENNSFTLTDEQRNNAFNEYLKYHHNTRRTENK